MPEGRHEVGKHKRKRFKIPRVIPQEKLRNVRGVGVAKPPPDNTGGVHAAR